MAMLIDIFGFLSVVIRGAVLVTQSFLVGGIAFLLLMGPVARECGSDGERPHTRGRRFLFWSALPFALTERAGGGGRCEGRPDRGGPGLGDRCGRDLGEAGRVR